MSMYRQLWLAIVVSMLLALCGSLLASLLSARGYLESQLSVKNTDNATALALSLSQSHPDPVSAGLVLDSLFDSGHYASIRITDPKGKVIAERVGDTEDLDAPAWFVRLLPIAAMPGQAQISSGWQQFGTVTLVSQSRFAYGALWKSAYQMVLVLAAAGALGGLLGSLVLRRIRQPLNTLIGQAYAITQRRFVTVEDPHVPELRQLAVAMNVTVGRLKTMFDEEATRLELVRQEANFDALTGLANRSYFMAQLRQCVDAEDSVGGALVLVRLGHLAAMNVRLGREATDVFLKSVGHAVAAQMSATHAGVAARLNGADFAVLLPAEAAGLGFANLLMQTLTQLATPYVEDAVRVAVGQFAPGDDMGALLARVDVALAAAEMQFPGQVSEAVQDTAGELPRTAEQWATLIRSALDQHWLRLVSFPVVNAQGRLSHMECPLRLMFDAKGDWLPAGRFLPVAERLHLTPALDLAAVRLGLSDLEAQPVMQGLAINVSASSLADADFPSQLLALLDQHRGAAASLWLEVSELGALRNLNALRALSPALKARGCKVGLEHFGHQFTHIGALHDVGLDYLKVDASFVRSVDVNTGNAAFLKGLCAIAHSLGLLVFAEGVATAHEHAVLQGLGFDGATGPAIQAVA